MGLTVFEYARGVNDFLKNQSTYRSKKITDMFNKEGVFEHRITIRLLGDKIEISHTGGASILPDKFFDFLYEEYRPYTYEISMNYDEDKVWSKKAPSDENCTRLLSSMLELHRETIKDITLKTNKFTIKYTSQKNKEWTTISLPAIDQAKHMFRKMLNEVFPYVRIPMNITKVENIIKYTINSLLPKRVDTRVDIKIDGSSGGVKVGSVAIP